MMFRTSKAIVLLLILSASVFASALSSDVRLIQMVPTDSQIVASMLSPKPGGQPDSLLLITGNNRIDLDDFFAVTGADTSRVMHQVIFVAAAGSDGNLNEHSLLVSGHFNRDAILRFAENGSGGKDSYRGIPILVVQPLARERSRFKHVRWLAILDSDIAVFGTPASVQRELDRQMAKSEPDALLMERLSRLGRRDETWCLLPVPLPGGAVEKALDRIDPRLGDIAREGASIQYGVHFGRQVEITASSNVVDHGELGSANERQTVPFNEAQTFMTTSRDGGNVSNRIAVVKMALRRYDAWLESFDRDNPGIEDSVSHARVAEGVSRGKSLGLHR